MNDMFAAYGGMSCKNATNRCGCFADTDRDER